MASRPPLNISDEPLTPAGRLFLQPETSTIIHCVLGVKNHMDIDAVKATINNSLLLKQPRFNSLLIRDDSGREYWRRTEIDIERHVVLVNNNVNDELVDDEKVINNYIADLAVSTPLSTNKPLWEVHIMVKQKCAIFRIHHALGDGVSLMSMLLASCRTAEDPTAEPRLVAGGGSRRGRWEGKDWRGVFMGVLKMLFFSIVYCLEFVLRCLFVGDRKIVISGGDGVELWPRKVATAKFLIDDMKMVKRAVANATINDVLFGIISVGLSRYLDFRSPHSLQDGQQLTGLAMVNLRQQPQLQNVNETTKNNSESGWGWGNRFGIFLLPVYYHKDVEPLEHVKRVQPLTSRKKNSLEAHFSYIIGYFIMKWVGPKAAALLNYRIFCNTTFSISNVLGPKEEITIAGNPISFIRVNTSSLPQAIAMHMVSYAGRADMQIVVAKDIIPDPEFLAKCFEDALLEMKKAVAATT